MYHGIHEIPPFGTPLGNCKAPIFPKGKQITVHGRQQLVESMLSVNNDRGQDIFADTFIV